MISENGEDARLRLGVTCRVAVGSSGRIAIFANFTTKSTTDTTKNCHYWHFLVVNLWLVKQNQYLCTRNIQPRSLHANMTEKEKMLAGLTHSQGVSLTFASDYRDCSISMK